MRPTNLFVRSILSMKYLFALLLLVPTLAFASPVSVNRLNNDHIEPLNRFDFFKVQYITGTSTTATSTLPNLTTTNLEASASFNLLGTYITNVSTWFNGLFDTQLATKTTTNLAEGTNLYYTLARWASALAGTTTDALPQGSTNLYNQTHTGEVTGATALTVADNVIDEANLKINTAVDGYAVTASSTASGGLAWAQIITDFLTFGDGLTRTANDVDCDTASGSVFGCLSSTDWTTFNNKQPAGNYITALTGDVTASGPGSVAATLATVNSNVGTFGSATQAPALTVNGKGLITAVSNTTITPAVGSITGLGTGVATALGVNVGTAGAFVVNGGALGTPSSGTVTNLTGTASININGTVGATTPTTGVFTNLTTTNASTTNLSIASTTNIGATKLLGVTSSGAVMQATETTCNVGGGTFFQQIFNGVPFCAVVNVGSSDIAGTLPVARGGTGITSLGSGVATWLGTPSSANLATAVTDETGSGALVFGTSPAFTTSLSTPAITTASGDLTITPAAGSDLSVNLSTTGDFAVNTDDFFVDTSAGRIGVGTVLPTQTLDIETNENANSIFLLKNASSTGSSAAGVIRVSADTALTQVIAHGTGRTISRYGITLGGWSEIAPSAGNGLIIGTINATPLIFGTSGAVNTAEAMRITTDNRIGIGETAPATNVEINSASGTTTMQMLSTTASVGSRIILEDVDGAGCTEITTLNGTITGKIVTCL